MRMVYEYFIINKKDTVSHHRLVYLLMPLRTEVWEVQATSEHSDI